MRFVGGCLHYSPEFHFPKCHRYCCHHHQSFLHHRFFHQSLHPTLFFERLHSMLHRQRHHRRHHHQSSDPPPPQRPSPATPPPPPPSAVWRRPIGQHSTTSYLLTTPGLIRLTAVVPPLPYSLYPVATSTPPLPPPSWVTYSSPAIPPRPMPLRPTSLPPPLLQLISTPPIFLVTLPISLNLAISFTPTSA